MTVAKGEGKTIAGTSSPLRMAAEWLLLSLRLARFELDRNPKDPLGRLFHLLLPARLPNRQRYHMLVQH
jgi:hypothetical protein